MADVYAVFGTLLALGIVFPGLLFACWLLFPTAVDRSHVRIRQTPGRTIGVGCGVAGLTALPILILLGLPYGPAKFAGAVLIALTLAFACVGAAGLVSTMALRLAGEDGRHTSAGSFLQAAVALELAAAFPIIGWFVVIPLSLITSLGAATFALFRRLPRGEATYTPEVQTSGT